MILSSYKKILLSYRTNYFVHLFLLILYFLIHYHLLPLNKEETSHIMTYTRIAPRLILRLGDKEFTHHSLQD